MIVWMGLDVGKGISLKATNLRSPEIRRSLVDLKLQSLLILHVITDLIT